MRYLSSFSNNFYAMRREFSVNSVVQRRYINLIKCKRVIVNSHNIKPNHVNYLYDKGKPKLKEFSNNKVNIKILKPLANFEQYKPNLCTMDFVKFFISPKSVLTNICDTVSNKLNYDTQTILTINEKLIDDKWISKLNLKWPYDIEIEQTATSKNEATYKSSLLALILLKENNFINENGKPVLKKVNDHFTKVCYTKNVYNIFTDGNKDEIVEYKNENIKTNKNVMEKIKLPEVQLFNNTNFFFNSMSKVNLGFINQLSWNKLIITPDHVLNSAILFKQTLNTFNCIFQKASLIFNQPLEPSFNLKCHNSRYWICSYNLVWPRELETTQIGCNKIEARYNAANDILAFLLANDYITKSGKINRNFGKINNFNNNLNGIQKRTYCTQIPVENNSKTTDENLVSENDIEKTKRLFPLPKHILNNIYELVSRDLQNSELKPVAQYKLLRQGNTTNWLCTYNVKWPEDMKFTHISNTKQEASNKAAIAILTWLKQKNKINKQGRPILIDANLINKANQTSPIITLSNNTRIKMQELINEYEKHLKPFVISETIKNVNFDFDEKIIADIFQKPLRQKFKGSDFYKATETLKLPITDYRDEIMNEIDKNQVVIIRGEPGCGKSTRVPQYILENWAEKRGSSGEPCRIAVTQPRRIAAISLSERVAKERNENPGNTVGYQVRLKSNFNNQSGRILYCTTGILLRQLQTDPKLSNYTHLILDEAHERDVNTDLLMNLLRNSIETNPKLKLIIMSATLDTKLFQNYFDEPFVIHVPGFTYPVKSYYLDSCKGLDLSATIAMCNSDNPHVVHEDVSKAIKYIHKNYPEGAILCFLPGWEEISKVKLNLVNIPNINVLCLHSRLQDSEQWQIFSKSPPGIRKVILSTNIAETSVTINDVVYVIDSGIQKEKRYDAKKGIMCIDNHWISQANVNQRIGRAGRVQPGKSFHLYPRAKYEKFDKFALPEILRTSLTKIVLDSKVYSNNMDAVKFLAELPTPPETNTIMRAIEDLIDLELLDENENLTPLGRTLSDFQLEPKLAKCLVLAVIFKCVTPIVDIVTLFSSEIELFAKSLTEKQTIQKCKKDFSQDSDHLSMMRMFEKWLEYVEENDNRMASYFITANKLVPDKLFTIQKLRDLHFEYLYKGLKNVLPLSDNFSDNDDIVKGVLLSGVGTVLQHRSWDVVNGRMKKSNVLLTRHNQKATITSDSVNFKRTNFASNLLLYINETISNLRRTTIIRESSLISPIILLLFKNKNILIENETNVDKNNEHMVLVKMEGSKIQFSCSKEDAEMLKRTKEALQGGIQYYIFQLTAGGKCDELIEDYWKSMLNKLAEILTSSKN